MSERDLRPQPVVERGLRVALVAPKRMTDPVMLRTLADIERVGWIMVCVISPERFYDSLRMIMQGLVDRVVIARPEYFPHVVLASDLHALASSRPAQGRTRILPRTSNAPEFRTRRPQFVSELSDTEVASPIEDEGRTRPVDRRPEFRRAVADSATPRPDPSAEIPQSPARSANAGSEFGNGLPDPAGRRRTSERHSRTVTQGRKRRTA